MSERNGTQKILFFFGEKIFHQRTPHLACPSHPPLRVFILFLWIVGESSPTEDKKKDTHRTVQQRDIVVEREKMSQYKIILLGDFGVGKTSLFTRFFQGTEGQRSSIEEKEREKRRTVNLDRINMDFYQKNVELNDPKDSSKTLRVSLKVYDTAGTEKYQTITRAFYRDAAAALIVYRLDNKSTFVNVEDWHGDVVRYAEMNCMKFVVGNKRDRVDAAKERREVSEAEANDLAETIGFTFLGEITTKSQAEVDQLFVDIARHLVNAPGSKRIVKEPRDSVNLKERPAVKTSVRREGCAC